MLSRRLGRPLHAFGVVLGLLGLAHLHASRLAEVPYDLWSSPQLAWTAVLALLLLITSYTVGLPDLVRRRTEAVIGSLVTLAVCVVGVSLVQAALGTQLLPRSVLGLSVLLYPPFTLLTWNVVSDLTVREAARDRVLVVADDPDDVRRLQVDLGEDPERPATVVGSLRPDEARTDRLAGRQHLLDAADVLRPTVVVLDAVAQADASIVHQVTQLHGRGVRFRTMSLFYEEWLGKLPMGELERVSLLFDIGELHRARYTRLKRLIDVSAASLGLVVLVPVMAAVAVGNRIGNRGPLFFRQVRVGKGGEPFEILKFRTMRSAHDGDHCSWTREGDARVTPFGRILRRSHLDELPQLINILRGDCSLVGPRPEQVTYVEELRSKMPFYDVRHLVRPGVTGWAQVKMGYAADEAGALEKLQYDLCYLRHQGLTLDARILVRTLRHLVVRGGR